MEGDDRKELARQRLSCFADSLMTDYSLSKAAVVRAMKAYIASNKPKNKDVEVEECRGNLAWTTSCLSDSKSLSSSVLFFVLDPSMNLSEDSAEKIGLRCIICNTVFCMVVMRNGNPSRNTHVLSSHLNRQHNDLASLVESRYPTMGHLLSELDWNRLSCKSTFSSSTQKSIHKYFVRRDDIPDEVEGVVSNHDVGIEPSQEKKRLVIVPDPLTRKRNKAVLAAVVLGIPLSWDVNKEPEYKELIKVLNVPSYYHIGKTLSDMTRQYQTCVKKCLQDYPFLSLCCDGWSVVKPAKSMEVFFATVFKGDEFKSILVDCVPMDRSTANDLVDTLERIRSEYRLPSNTMITTDGASNNKKAFEGQRAVCSAHAINTVIAHMTSNCRHYEGKKNGITFNDLKAIREHFNRVNAVCTCLTGAKARDYKRFVEAYKSVNVDMDNTGCLPERISPTRWLGVAVQMRWLLKYGLLFYRFALLCYDSKKSWMEGFLTDLEESSFIVFMLERALNLLTPCNKPTLHLVLPVRETMKTVLADFEAKTTVGKGMKALLEYELNEGCLMIPQGRYYDYCCTASVLYPGIYRIISESIVDGWFERANKLLWSTKVQWEMEGNLNILTDGNRFNDLKDFCKPFKQGICVKDDLLSEIMTPQMDECQVKGFHPDRFTYMYWEKITTIPIGKKKWSIFELEEEIGKMKREMKDLNKKKADTNNRMKEIEEEGEKEKKEKVTKKKGNIKSVKHLSLGKRFDTYASAICMCLGKEAEKMREEYNKLRDKKNAFDRLLERKMVQLEAMVEAVKRDQEEKRVSDMEMYGIKEMETIEVDDSDVSDEEESGKDVEQFTITEREYVSTYSQLYSLTPLIELCHVVDLGGLRNPIECLAELVLSVSATEAVCERFFRQASLTVKRQYVTNMNNETVRSVAMIKYNRDVFDAICYGRDVLSVLSFVC